MSTLQSAWQGTACDAAIAKPRSPSSRCSACHESLTRLQATLTVGGVRLTQTRNEVLRTSGQLQQQGWQVGPDGTVSVRAGSPLERFAQLSPVNAMKV